jgi:non-haem Fe2+, alpha-ketoglutarate-dependent halogenase
MVSAEAQVYERDGVLFPLPVLSQMEVAAFRAGFEDLERRLGEAGGTAKRVSLPHLFFRWAFDLATHPAVLDGVEQVLGPELLVNGTLILAKPARDPGFVPWHQDGVHSGLHRSPNTSAWIALSDSTPESGCMRVVPGSHLRPRYTHHESRAEHQMIMGGSEIDVEVDEIEALDVTLPAGSMSLHHSDIIHGSKPNVSGAPRIGFVVRFVTPETVQGDLPFVRARGRSDCGHLDLLPEPPGGDPDEAFTRWHDFARRRDAKR